mmetsp:Transcript_23319/g.73083  ORF Transcript_23319/g.73083 Transcript_23319/m.73083 type:complete len:137 (+) Transcript_23319:187-597(+)
MWAAAARSAFRRDGFVARPGVVAAGEAKVLREHYAALFRGDFPRGVYPDEWHWREGISKPDAFREIVNGWKVKALALTRAPTLAEPQTLNPRRRISWLAWRCPSASAASRQSSWAGPRGRAWGRMTCSGSRRAPAA